MFYYYEKDGLQLCSLNPNLPLVKSKCPKAGDAPTIFLFERDPQNCRAAFSVNHSGQILAKEEDIRFLDACRMPQGAVDSFLSEQISKGHLRAVNFRHPRWPELLNPRESSGKKRINLLAIGDVGSTLLIGLCLLGRDQISSIGICDISEKVTARWAMEMNQISLPWNYDAFPPVEVISPDQLFDCDLFAFIASKGIPPVGSGVKDVRMAQFEANSAIVSHYAKLAREKHYQGLWAAVSDPVDPLAKTAFLASNQNEQGEFDGLGLFPQQIQGYGLGVMNARAAYYAKRDSRFTDFLSEGRSFGPHGSDLVIANSISHYDDTLSKELTQLTVTANLKMREIGYKPYVAPAISSGALSLLLTLEGKWHCGSVYLGGAFMGVKNRYTSTGVETEVLPKIPDLLFNRIENASKNLCSLI